MSKISELTSASALAGTELTVVVQSGVTKKVTLDTVLALTDSFSMNVHTGPGGLTAGKVNELQTGDTFTLPAANSVPANYSLIAELPQTYGAFTPTVQRAGADLIVHSGGTDTNFIFDVGPESVRFISNGSNTWRI